MLQFDPAWFLLGLGKVYLLAIGILAAGGALAAGILKLWRGVWLAGRSEGPP